MLSRGHRRDVTFIPIDAPSRRDALQLVVTLGPASFRLVGELAAAGASAFRLNASHMAPPDLMEALARVHDDCPGAPVVVDLQGAKMRIDVRAPLDIDEGQTVTLSRTAGARVVVPHAEFFEQALPGETVSIDDGRLRLVLERVDTDTAEARALNAGRLQARKGINVEQHPVQLRGLTARDLEACRAAMDGPSAFAYSFMIDGDEASWLRAAAPRHAVIGKVERREATNRLADIARSTDAVWICRGDLGAQLGPAELARFVFGLAPRDCGVPVLMAGQVLEHLTSHPDPTRSEVCHLYDLVTRGFAGIVLSDETAIGRDPVHATGIAAALLASFRA
jgi:pyruvate kinase